MYALMYPILYIASIHCYIPLLTATSMSVCSVCIVLWHDHVNGEIKMFNHSRSYKITKYKHRWLLSQVSVNWYQNPPENPVKNSTCPTEVKVKISQWSISQNKSSCLQNNNNLKMQLLSKRQFISISSKSFNCFQMVVCEYIWYWLF